MNNFVVAKYGGSSMANPQVVANIIKTHPEQKIIVCSAPGKSTSYDHKLTDHLIALANNPRNDTEIQNIIARFKEIIKDLDQNFQAKLIKQLSIDLANNLDYRFILSRGEYYSAMALAERIGGKFIDAGEIFYFDKQGKLSRSKTAQKIKKRLKNTKQIIVVPGFYGFNQDKKVCLFRRGGSDRSGAIIAANLSVDYQNWTDVNGIMNADPAIISDAKTIKELTYEEVREGAHGGTKAFMGDTILDLEFGHPIITTVKNTYNPRVIGTIIKKTRKTSARELVIAISARDDLLGLTIHDMGMRDRKGYLASVLNFLAINNISVEHMPAAQDAVTITFHDKPNLDKEKIKRKLKSILVSPTGKIGIVDCGVVYLVGEKLRNLDFQHKVIIEALSSLENNNISIYSIMMHFDSPSVAVILRRSETISAQKILFKKFFADN